MEMYKYYGVTLNGKYIDVWDYSQTDNYLYARLYDTIEELKEDCNNLFQEYNNLKIKELVIDDEFNLISEKYMLI